MTSPQSNLDNNAHGNGNHTTGVVAVRRSPLGKGKKKRKRRGTGMGLTSRAKKKYKEDRRRKSSLNTTAVAAAAPIEVDVAAALAAEAVNIQVDGSNDEEWVPTGTPVPNPNSGKENDNIINGDEVDEEIYLDQLENYYQGSSKPEDQLYRRVDSRGRAIFTKDEHRQRRMAIHYLFSTVYGSPPEDTGLWGGNNGLVVRIRNQLLLPKTSPMLRTVRKTMRSIYSCVSLGRRYTGERDSHKPYEKYYIKTTDFEAQLIADLIEAGLGFTETTDKVNEWRRANGRVLPNGQTDVGRSCVYLTSKRLAPKVTVIKKRPQGSLNKESDWCRASHRWACQMLIMLGELKEDSQIPKTLYYDEKFGAMTVLPKCFTISLVEKVDIKCCVYGDESHKKARSGAVRGGTKVEHRYPRDEFGALDFSENGKYAVRGTEVHMKYTKEARFSFFMCLKLDGEGNIMYDTGPNGEKRPLGKVLESFEYTERKIISDPDHKKVFKQVMNAPKQAAKKGPWYKDNRVEGAIYEGDPVTELPNIGDKAKDELAAFDPPITTVKEFYDYFMNPDNIRTGMNRRKNVKKRVKGMSYDKVTTAMNAAERAIAGDPPEPTDYRKANNPYLARWPIKQYGPNRWVQEVENTATMRKFVNIRELVKHIIRICEEEFEGTQFQETWTFNHDALSLMCSKDCMEWMKTQGYLKRWVLPQHQLNQMFRYYSGKPSPVGNHPKAMPWDQSSNWDHDLIVLRHVAATAHLDEDDPRKFSLRTPKKVSYAYRRIYNNPVVERDGVPLLPAGECGIPAYRLGHDILATVDYWWDVFNNEGLNQAVNTAGHRGGEVRDAAREGRVKKTRGGPREKKPDTTDEESNWYHPDAKGEFENLYKNSMAKFNQRLKQVQKENGNVTQQKDTTGLDPDLVVVEEIQGKHKDSNNNNNNQASNEEEEEEDGEETDYEDDEVILALETTESDDEVDEE